MEYIGDFGIKVIVDGDKAQFENENGFGPIRKQVIGANFTNGVITGGYLSSFSGSFDDELIGIQSGLGNIVYTKIGDIKDAYELLKSKINDIKSVDLFELSRVVLETIDEFFGGRDNISERMDYYYPAELEEESKNNKISNLKGTGAAMCVERAALAQNLLKSLGINSFYKSSGIIKNNKEEQHCYNLIEFNGKYYIFDSSIPNLINNQVNPLIAEIDKETFTLLSAPIPDMGISTTVTHYNPYLNTDVSITYDSGRKKQVEVCSLEQKKPKHL